MFKYIYIYIQIYIYIYIQIYIYIYIYIYIQIYQIYILKYINHSETGIDLRDKKLLFKAMMDTFSSFTDVLKHNAMHCNSFYLFSLLNCVKYRRQNNILNH